jgi:glyoxylase-like metal-dependent hydrolase (beta-lactamase superfamily II)
MITAMKIGNVNAHVVTEIDSMPVPYEMLVEVADPQAMERNEGWSVPDYYDRATKQLRLSIHSWLLDTGHHKILVDPCVGNQKSRGAAQAFDMLDTPFIQRLEAAGARPEDIDYVFCTHLHVDHCGWNTRLVDAAGCRLFRMPATCFRVGKKSTGRPMIRPKPLARIF